MPKLIFKHLLALLTVILTFVTQVFAQVDLNEASSFYGYWEGKITFKAFAATQDMNIEIQKGKYPGSIGLIIFHDKANNLKNDTIHSNFENGVIKMEMSAKSVNSENGFCKGFLNIALLDENKMNGSFESEKKGCTAVEYFAARKIKELPVAKTEKMSAQEIPTENSDAMDNSEADATAREAELIKKCADGKIVHKKNILQIKLDNGKIATLKNNLADNDSFEKNRFDGCLPEMNMYKFDVQGWEWSSYLLLSKTDGKEYPLLNEPLLSPDKKKLVTFVIADGYSESDNFIFIYGDKLGKLVKEYELNPKSWGPAQIEWKSENRLVIYSGKMDEETGEIQKLATKTLSFINNKWILK